MAHKTPRGLGGHARWYGLPLAGSKVAFCRQQITCNSVMQGAVDRKLHKAMSQLAIHLCAIIELTYFTHFHLQELVMCFCEVLTVIPGNSTYSIVDVSHNHDQPEWPGIRQNGQVSRMA